MKKMVIVIIACLIILTVFFTIIKKINNKSYEYEIEEVKNCYYFKLYENEKFGVIDASGNIIVPARYSRVEIPNPSKPVFIGYLNNEGEENKTEVINDKNEKILEMYSRNRTS